jgi:hypothetical protein
MAGNLFGNKPSIGRASTRSAANGTARRQRLNALDHGVFELEIMNPRQHRRRANGHCAIGYMKDQQSRRAEQSGGSAGRRCHGGD